MKQDYYYLGFSLCAGIGSVRMQLLLHYFADVQKAWFAKEKDLFASGIGKRATLDIVRFRETFDPVKYAHQLAENDIGFITLGTKYPKDLLDIPRAPFLFYTKGDRSLLFDPKKIAVVGTRKMTSYGETVTESFTSALVQNGCTIVSGLAMGVDGVAHRTALNCGGRTIAVLGSGVDVCTPMENFTLYKNIITHGGLIISESVPGTYPVKGSFPSRNRIIAGLSNAVLVPEGAVDSGSLITANYAFDFLRKVYAIPGPITSRVSHGPYELVKKGALFVIHPDDMLRDLEMDIASNYKKKIVLDNNEMQQILDLLQEGSMYPDDIIRKIQLPPQQIGGLLSLMEMNGYIKMLSTGEVSLN